MIVGNDRYYPHPLDIFLAYFIYYIKVLEIIQLEISGFGNITK